MAKVEGGSRMFEHQHVSLRFWSIARECADRTALTFQEAGGWRQWSYTLLARRARSIAEQLQRLGVQPGTPVGLSTHRYPDTIAAMIGVLDLGAHFVPLDPLYPSSRTQQLREAAGVVLVVTAGEPADEPRVSIAAVTRSKAQPPPPAPGSGAAAHESPEAVAYVMFTSGSTGRPKGVVIPHRAITRLVAGQDFLRFDSSRVFLQAAPMSFDASTLEIWGPLLHGGRCVLYPSGALPTAAGLRDVIAATGVTTAWLTASLFHTLVDHDVRSLEGLEELVVGGEALSVTHVRKALDALPRTQLINGYGPTENTTFSACYRIPADLPRTATRVPIGTAIRGTQLAVVDDSLRLVAPGTEGELVAMGEGLALGYLGEPELTRERFVDLACADGVVRRCYRTGDRVVQQPDGVLDFLGRRDDQVKIHGYRIEPREVETVIASLSGVMECRVVVHHDATGQTRLAAYVVLGEGRGVVAIKQEIAAALPAFMVPHQVVVLPAIPLNQNGKLATESLPRPWEAPVPASPVRRSSHLASVELTWTEVLGRAPESSDVNFFDAGGRSLDTITLHGLLERRHGLTLDPTFVFEFPTPRRQAQALAILAPSQPQSSLGGKRLDGK